MRNLLVLFFVYSKFIQHFRFFDQSVTDPAVTVIQCVLCHWSSDGVLESLHLQGGESTTGVSVDD